LNVWKECITLEEVKSCVYTREFRLKASESVNDALSLGLVVFKKDKKSNKIRVDFRDIYKYCKHLGYWRRNCLRLGKEDQVATAGQKVELFDDD